MGRMLSIDSTGGKSKSTIAPASHFANRSRIAVGDITGISKLGWEYTWARYADSEDAAAKSPTLQSYGDGAAIVKKPVAVYVERVYEYGDFSLLGIGT